MTEQKQEYQRPVVEVLVVESNDIICSSTAAEPENSKPVHGSGFGGLTNGGSLN